MKLLILPPLIVLPTLTALTYAAPLHPFPPSNPHTKPSASSTPTTISNPASGQIIDNILPNNGLPGGGIGSSLPDHAPVEGRYYSPVGKRDEAGEDVKIQNSSTWYDEDAEREAEDLALVLDAADENWVGGGKGEAFARSRGVREWEE